MEGSLHHEAKEIFQAGLNSGRFNDAKGSGNCFECRQSLGVILSSESPPGLKSLGKPDHFCVVKSGKPSPHPGGLPPVAIRNHQGDRPAVLIQKTPVEDGRVIPWVEEEGSSLGNVEVAEIKGSVLMTVNPQFTVGQRFQGEWTGCRGLILLAAVHHEDDAGFKEIPGDRRANAQIGVHPASLATFTSL
jgi:hypothetical protein